MAFEIGRVFFETEIVKVGDDAASAETLNGDCGRGLCSWRPALGVLRGTSPFGWEMGCLSSFLGIVIQHGTR